MDWITFILILTVGLVLVIGLFVLLAVIALFFGRREFQKRIFKFLKPDPRDIERDIEHLYQKYPNSTPDEMASAYVSDQAKFLGLAAFITVIPFLGTAIDLSFTTLRQMRMLHVITALYGNNRLDPEELEVKYMAMVGGTGLLGRFLIKILTGEIPVLNCFINCGLNWFVTKRIGEIGIGWNNEKGVWETTRESLGSAKQKVLNAKDQTLTTINATFRRPGNSLNSNYSFDNETDQGGILNPLKE